MTIIDGKSIAAEIEEELAGKIKLLTGRKPTLAVVLVGEHPPSRIYVNKKTKACINVGIHSIKSHLPDTTSEQELLDEIERLNRDPSVDGILVQLPLPPHINPNKINSAISPDKDVDGFHPINVGKLLIGDTDGFQPCTPLGIKVLLERTGIIVEGKHVVIVGRSNIVGKPMAAMMMQAPWGNATVTVAHRKSIDLSSYTILADILITAVGQPNFITADMVKKGVVVIDVGINKINDATEISASKVVGDVDFEHVKEKCSFITPVPGGVGPMTIAMLLHNTLKSYKLREGIHD